MNQTDIIVELERSGESVLRQYDAPEIDLAKSYGPGKWSVRQILAHLADDEVVSLWRVCRAAAEPGSLVHGFNENAWAAKLHYTERPMPTAKVLFAANRAQMIEFLQLLSPTVLDHTIHHSERGEMTLKSFLESVVWHTWHHLEQIDAARSGRIWPPQEP
ncbi:MAG: hypothetical protein AMXMBFR84_29240 [Candidatus Hydrogenedentota bacterium]